MTGRYASVAPSTGVLVLRRLFMFALVCCLLVLAIFAAASCQAEPVIRLSSHMDGVGTQMSMRYLEDAGHHYTFDQVRRETLSSAFTPLPLGRSNLGISGSDFWVHIDVQNPANTPLSWLLEASYPLWNHIDFYVGGEKVLSVGDFEPFARRPVAAESNVLPLTTPAGATEHIWVHFSNKLPSIANIQLRLWTPKAFHQHEAFNYLTVGIFLGIGIVLFFYNLLIGHSTRMFEYLWYTSYIFASVMTLLTSSGFGSRYLWPDVHWFINFAPVLFVMAMLMLATQFTRSFLNTAREAVVIDRLLLAVFALGGVTLLCYFLGWRGVSLRLLFLCAFISVLYPLIGIWQYRKGRRDARFYVAGWSVWSLAMIVAVLRHAGLLADDFITYFSPATGFSMEAILLSFALADRINRLRDEKAAIELAHIEHLQHEQDTLERVVKERTVELEQAMERSEVLAMTDALTGLLNRRAFFELGEKEYERARRYDTSLAVIMFDLDDFKEINDQHGHAAGDTVLVAVAGALRRMIRKADTAGRIGGEEFAVLLPATDLQTASDLAQRLRRTFEELRVLADGEHLKITASFGVAGIEVGHETLDASLHRADMALYRAKTGGRNRVEQAQARVVQIVPENVDEADDEEDIRQGSGRR